MPSSTTLRKPSRILARVDGLIDSLERRDGAVQSKPQHSLQRSGCEMVTVAVRRVQAVAEGHAGLMEAIAPTTSRQIDGTGLREAHSMTKSSTVKTPSIGPKCLNHKQGAGQATQGATDAIQPQHDRLCPYLRANRTGLSV